MPHLPKFEAVIDILASIFGGRDITVLEEEDGTSIHIINQNQRLKAYYVDRKPVSETQYTDKIKKEYIGFVSGDYGSLNWFFAHLINRFITCGIKIKTLSIDFNHTRYSATINNYKQQQKNIKNLEKQLKEETNGK
ncbi:MAG: hypothetical protein FWE18_04460 [Alphaproteobacteria bacterium]|nr:hypothetical protein [Alphaproteobacteria bacterium]